MMSIGCIKHWLLFTHTHTHTSRAPTEREGAQDKEVEQHTNISTLCNQSTSKHSPPIYLCLPVNQKAFSEHAQNHMH